MKSLNDVTPRRTASGIPSRMWGSWFRMKWKPKSSTERDSASSRSLTSAFGSVSPSSPTTNGTSVVSPVRAAAMGAVDQSSYSGPTWRWQSMSPGSTYFPAASITRAAGGSSDSGPIAALADREHLVEVDPRHPQLVAVRRGAGEHLAQRADDRAPRDQLHAVLDARLGDADHEAEVRVRARTETELVEVERERRAWRVVA